MEGAVGGGPGVVAVLLSRNVGHQAAFSAALDHVSGDGAVLLDGDLQDPPEEIPRFVQGYLDGYDVVYAKRERRKEPLWLRFSYWAYYRLLARMANLALPLDAGDFSLLSRRVIDEIRRSPERHRYLRGLRAWAGFRQLGVPVERAERHAGRSKYSLARLVELGLDGIFSFSIVPIRAAAFLGAAAAAVARWAKTAVDADGAFHFAVSGGRSPWAMFGELALLDVPWDRTTIYQVDERVAAGDDPARNLAHLRDALADAPAKVVPMPVETPDLDAAAGRYGQALPGTLHLVHLGIGPDGHTASLVPGDPVLEVTDRPVALTATEYEGHRRMTLTYPTLARARQLVWLVSGQDKREPLTALLRGDRSIPAGRVEAAASLVLADRAAAPDG